MNRYFYDFAQGWSSADTLTEARKMVRYILKQDKCTHSLFHDKEGRVYVKRCDYKGNLTIIY